MWNCKTVKLNIHEAKAQLSRLIAAVEQGEEFVIARYGKPVARLVPIRPSTPTRKPGSARGKFKVPPSFFEPLPEEILDAFEK